MSTPEVLVSAIRERLDEIERKARAAATRPDIPRWRIGKTQTLGSPVVLDDDATPTVVIETFAERYEDVNDHIVLHDPSSVLRRVQADRKIIDGYETILRRVAEYKQWMKDNAHRADVGGELTDRIVEGYELRGAIDALEAALSDLADGLGIDLPEDTDG